MLPGRYQLLKLLNESRKKHEGITDDICESEKLSKPRMYREEAKKNCLSISKSRQKTYKKIRAAIRKQLGYIIRDIGYIENFAVNGVKLTDKQKAQMNLITAVYEQQRIMYEEKSRSIAHRIVSLPQAHVRPIQRGKVTAKT